jgi:DNA-binding transcriptional ArsR family regulator
MKLEELDSICDDIFAFFIVFDENIGFNDLLKSLKKMGVKISRPTLSDHLKHLTKKKVLTRKKQGKQRVFYKLNWKMFENLRDGFKDGKTMSSFLNKEEIFHSLSLDEQVNYLSNVLTLGNLIKLRTRALGIIEPDNVFEYNLEYRIFERYFRYFEDWLLKSGKENKDEFRKRGLPLIDSKIEHFKQMLFNQKSGFQ